ncbi:DUF4352 domain-containing protein [Nocardia sp. NPDC050406]|uniref:DUF4352 domain-containing protein n=1 Tax=Nocardia sp. NPDC050406 TaxID=3364318 RepID=UPI0037879911
MNYPQPPQQPGSGQYPQPPRRKSRTVLWVILGITGGMILLCGGCFGILAMSDKDSAPEKATAEVAPVGSAVRDGKFEFVVTGVDEPAGSVGDNPYMKKDAQGVYIVVRVDVTNIGDKPQTYFGENQKLIDAQGKQFTNDSMAEANINTNVIATEINPGNKVPVAIAFDVPAGTDPVAIEFHDSMFSGGARVALK